MSLSDSYEPARYVRAMHPYAYKSGKWAQIVGERERNGRRVWLIVWPDGATDEWVVEDDHAQYELTDEATDEAADE